MRIELFVLGALLSIIWPLLMKYLYYPIVTESVLLLAIYLIISSLRYKPPRITTVKYQHFDEDLSNFQDIIVTFELRKMHTSNNNL